MPTAMPDPGSLENTLGQTLLLRAVIAPLPRPRRAGPARAKQDRGRAPVPLRSPQGKLEVQRGGQRTPRAEQHAHPVGHGIRRGSGGTSRVHHPCGNTSASRGCLITELTCICRQGLAAPAFTTLALFIGDL